jgi:hypothetical protein
MLLFAIGAADWYLGIFAVEICGFFTHKTKLKFTFILFGSFQAFFYFHYHIFDYLLDVESKLLVLVLCWNQLGHFLRDYLHIELVYKFRNWYIFSEWKSSYKPRVACCSEFLEVVLRNREFCNLFICKYSNEFQRKDRKLPG